MNRKKILKSLTIAQAIFVLGTIILFFITAVWRFWLIAVFYCLALLARYGYSFLVKKGEIESSANRVFVSLLDSVLILGLFFLLFNFAGMPKLIFFLLFLRELVVDGIKNYMLVEDRALPNIKIEPYKIAAQSLVVFCALISLVYDNLAWLNQLVYLSGAVTVFLSYYSGLMYFQDLILYVVNKDNQDSGL